MLGLTLGQHLPRPGARAPAAATSGGPGWGKAKSVIMVYLQGGPSHLDLWDPKDNVPDNVRSAFKQHPDQDSRHAVHRNPAASSRR